MEERNYPIQMVETRGQQDVFFKEGGGSSKLPQWATLDMIKQHAVSVSNSLGGLESVFDERDDVHSSLPVLAVASLHKSAASAKRYRANARSLFDGRDRRNIVGLSGSDQLVVKIDNKEELDRIALNFQADTLDGLSKDKLFGIAAVTSIERYIPYVDPNIAEGPIKIKLADYKNEHLNSEAERIFLADCQKKGINVRKAKYAPELRIFSADNCTREDIQALASMDSVFSVRQMPYFEISVSPDSDNTTIDVKNPVDGNSYPIVGLMDSGIENIPHLSGWIDGQEQNIPRFASNYIDRRHGTAVASVLNYGDELEGVQYTKCIPMKIRSCIVNTHENYAHILEEEMIEHIKNALDNNSDIKIWNLSQGSVMEINDNVFSDFAVTIDKYQKEKNLLICKSAGNIRENGHERLSLGAESARSLVVGSAANKYVAVGDAQVGQRSFFSRIGPGPGLIAKPDVSHYGGNTHSGVCTLTETGFQCKVLSGTSFSTPRVTALASNLLYALNRDFDSTLIKALIIHSATYPNTTGKDNKVLLAEMGHGIPADLESILNNTADDFTMIFQPDLRTDMQIQDIPFPESMVDEDGNYYGEITVTMVSDPILRASEGPEYCQSDVDILLQTYDGIKYCIVGAVGTSPYYRNSDRLIRPQNLLAKGLYTDDSFKLDDIHERTILEATIKFQPTKKYHINLENLKNSEKWAIKADRKWCLSIKTHYRDSLVAETSANGEHIEPIKATIIITIHDPRQQGIAYNECYRALENHQFPHTDVILRQEIDLINKG